MFVGGQHIYRILSASFVTPFFLGRHFRISRDDKKMKMTQTFFAPIIFYRHYATRDNEMLAIAEFYNQLMFYRIFARD